MAISYNDAKEHLLQAFVTEWATETPYVFPNETEEPVNHPEWVRASFQNISSPQTTLGRKGNRKFGRNSLLSFQVFTKIDEGSARSDELVEKLVSLYEGETINCITVDDVTPREVGPDGKWYLVVVEVSFRYDTIK